MYMRLSFGVCACVYIEFLHACGFGERLDRSEVGFIWNSAQKLHLIVVHSTESAAHEFVCCEVHLVKLLIESKSLQTCLWSLHWK